MRVIAGTLRHRIINECHLETTRETQDRVREAIFNSLGPIYGNCLDLFCGSGAMAIEAYSRGSNYIVINDLNSKALDVALGNMKSLNITSYKAYNLDYLVYLSSCNEAFSYIFLDPPYRYDNTLEILKALLHSKAVKKGTKIIFEMARTTNNVYPSEMIVLKEKTYGKKKVIFYEVL